MGIISAATAWLDTFDFVGGWFILGGGVWASVMGAVHVLTRRKTAPKVDSKTDTIVNESRALRVAAILSSAPSFMSVQDIASQLSWTEPAVVSGLYSLLEQGRVEEDLDLDTGHWRYRLEDNEGQIDRAALSLDARAELANSTLSSDLGVDT